MSGDAGWEAWSLKLPHASQEEKKTVLMVVSGVGTWPVAADGVLVAAFVSIIEISPLLVVDFYMWRYAESDIACWLKPRVPLLGMGGEQGIALPVLAVGGMRFCQRQYLPNCFHSSPSGVVLRSCLRCREPEKEQPAEKRCGVGATFSYTFGRQRSAGSSFWRGRETTLLRYR